MVRTHDHGYEMWSSYLEKVFTLFNFLGSKEQRCLNECKHRAIWDSFTKRLNKLHALICLWVVRHEGGPWLWNREKMWTLFMCRSSRHWLKLIICFWVLVSFNWSFSLEATFSLFSESKRSLSLWITAMLFEATAETTSSEGLTTYQPLL